MEFISKARLMERREKIPFPRGLRLEDHIRPASGGSRKVYEFIGTDSFGEEWYERQRYEIDAGRDQEPILYTPIYEEIRDSSLPKNVPINRIGPGGVVLQEIEEGGEVKFASIGESADTVSLVHYGVGLEYSDDLVAYNQFWQVPIVERQVGIAYNALLNHVHLNPILTFSYAAANQTPANTAGATVQEDYLLTIQDAITNSKTDTTNPRRGPYALLVSSGDVFAVERALTRVPQEGVAIQIGQTFDQISTVIAYDGWTGTRGKLTTTYSGVSSGTGYLIDLGRRGSTFQSFMKQDLSEYGRDEDVSRFLMQIVWDTRFGAFSDPVEAVEEITWP